MIKLQLEVQSVLAKLTNIERELISEGKEKGWVFSGDSIVGHLVGRDVHTVGPFGRDFAP